MKFDQVDRDSDVPPFEQIVEMLRRAITSGQLTAGERLPAETKMAEQFGVARMTLRRAVQELRAEGFLVAASGRGVAVRPASGIREVWPQEPGYPSEATPQDFKAWGDAAPIIAQAENIRTRVHTLSGDLSELGLLVGDPAVVDKLVRALGGISLAQADILGALAIRLHMHLLDPERSNEVFNAMEAARRAFAEACGAAQTASKILRQSTSDQSDMRKVQSTLPSPKDAND
ncbi:MULTISPECIES: GntR family transcriptional regulator [Mycolicibacterium]|uniref:GntR family transcriptional regulator n=1 Tax=Mycolicibacterium TaxID=1866885 RepID=UPI001F1C55DA|nr:GntR family transcriptional regulator [Mycolicibacterium chitae]